MAASRRALVDVSVGWLGPYFDGRFCGRRTRLRRRAVARRRSNLVGGLRAVEELASISEFPGSEVGTDLHRRSAPWAVPTGRANTGLRTQLLRLRGDSAQLASKRQIGRPAASGQEA